VVPQGLSKTAALMCTKPPCCIQKLCCGYSCIIPNDDNCAACGDKVSRAAPNKELFV